MLTTIKRNSEYNAREWMLMVGALVVQLSATVVIVTLAIHNPTLKLSLAIILIIGLLVGCVSLPTLSALRQKGEGKPKRPLWKRFDDTHHWDSTAEEWVPNDDR
jgi:hypothetical protein